MKGICIGFCVRKPCNCEDVVNHLQQYRREKLKCAKKRTSGHKCECPEGPCDKDVDHWEKQIEAQSFESWYMNNEKSKYLRAMKLIDLKKKALKGILPNKWRWVTISANPELQPNELFELVKSAVMNKPFIKYIYCMEFYGKELKYHPHVHLLYEVNESKKSGDIKALARKFNIKSNFIDLKEIPQNQLKEKLIYIKGEKQEAKNAQVMADIELRQKNNLKDYYYNDDLLSNLNVDGEDI